MNTELRQVKVIYSNGYTVNTAMAAHLTDQEIHEYFKVGKWFNIGSATDNMQQVKEVEILK